MFGIGDIAVNGEEKPELLVRNDGNALCTVLKHAA